MTVRTVLNATLTNASTYSSGSLFVGDLTELAIDCHVTALTGTSGSINITLSRIGADGHAYGVVNVLTITLPRSVPFDETSSVGAGLVPTAGGGSGSVSFGDQIQLDLTADTGNSVTTTISIKGKG